MRTTYAVFAGLAATASLAACSQEYRDDAPDEAPGYHDQKIAPGIGGTALPPPPDVAAPDRPADSARTPSTASPFVGSWLEAGATSGRIELLASGAVRTDESGLDTGRWEPAGDGIVIQFAEPNPIRITARLDGDVLVLISPDGREGRFERQG